MDFKPSTIIEAALNMKFKSRLIALLTFSIGFNVASILLSFLHSYGNEGKMGNETTKKLIVDDIISLDQTGERSQRLMRAIQNSAASNELGRATSSAATFSAPETLSKSKSPKSTLRKSTTTTKSSTTSSTTTTTRWKAHGYPFKNVHSMAYRSLSITNKNSPLKVILFDVNNLMNYTRKALPSVAHYLSPSGDHLENQTFLSQNDIIKAKVAPAIVIAIDYANYDVAKATIRDIHQKLLPKGFQFIIYNTGMSRRQLERLRMFCLCSLETLDFSRLPLHVRKSKSRLRPLIVWDTLFRLQKNGVWWFEPGSRISLDGAPRPSVADKNASTQRSDPWTNFLSRGLKLGLNFLSAAELPLKGGGKPAYPPGVHSKCVTHPNTFIAMNRQYHIHFTSSPPIELSMFLLFRTELTVKGFLLPSVVCVLDESCVAPNATTPACDNSRDGMTKTLASPSTKNSWCGCHAHERSVMSAALHRLYHWNKNLLAKPAEFAFFAMSPGDLSGKNYF